MRVSASAERRCRRPVCTASATATLTFAYDAARVTVLPLVDEPHPTRWDLCGRHADALVVPRGWDHDDQRRPAGPPATTEHPAPDTSTPVTSTADAPSPSSDQRGPQRAESGRTNRYAALTARLADIAASHRAGVGDGRDADGGPPDAAGSGVDRNGDRSTHGSGTGARRHDGERGADVRDGHPDVTSTGGSADSHPGGDADPADAGTGGKGHVRRPPIGLHPDLATLAGLSADPVIPGQLQLPLDAGPASGTARPEAPPVEREATAASGGDAGLDGAAGSGGAAGDDGDDGPLPGNVVPLLRHGGVLDPVS